MTYFIKTTATALIFVLGGAAAFACPIPDGPHLPPPFYSAAADLADDATEVAGTCTLCLNCCNGSNVAA
jgi:hypothetical protein